MADDKKISQLPAAGALTGSETLEIVQGGTNKQTTTQDIADLAGGGDVTTAQFRRVREVTGASAVVQADDNGLIIFNSGSNFDFTIDQLTANVAGNQTTKVSYINIGAGAVTLVAGSGVTITGRTTVPGSVNSEDFPGGVIIWNTATAVTTVTGKGTEPEVVTVSTASGTITIDCQLATQIMFIGSASFATAKDIALDNDDNVRVISGKFNVTNVAAVLTFPSTFTMFDNRWNDTDHELTFDTTGVFEFSMTNYGDGEWLLKVHGPYP